MPLVLPKKGPTDHTPRLRCCYLFAGQGDLWLGIRVHFKYSILSTLHPVSAGQGDPLRLARLWQGYRGALARAVHVSGRPAGWATLPTCEGPMLSCAVGDPGWLLPHGMTDAN